MQWVLTLKLPVSNFVTSAVQAPMGRSLARAPERIAGCAQLERFRQMDRQYVPFALQDQQILRKAAKAASLVSQGLILTWGASASSVPASHTACQLVPPPCTTAVVYKLISVAAALLTMWESSC